MFKNSIFITEIYGNEDQYNWADKTSTPYTWIRQGVGGSVFQVIIN